ncbi:MAG: hypothetical protein ACI9R3_001599 [Verrucomicrobiales bacterium]|jgi:hypothetical protein
MSGLKATYGILSSVLALFIGFGGINAGAATAGRIDPSYQLDIQGVTAVCKLRSGKILLGGSLERRPGGGVGHLIRLNADGTVDPSFDIGTGPDRATDILQIVELGDGRILVHGSFSSFDGHSTNLIARLQSDGSVDRSFEIFAAFPSGVLAISSGYIFFGSPGVQGELDYFLIPSTANLQEGITKLEGFNTPQSVALQEDGRLLHLRNGLLRRYLSDGTQDAAFNARFANVNVGGVSVLTDGRIHAETGSEFFPQYIDDIAVAGILLLDPNGNIDTSFQCECGAIYYRLNLSLR